MALLDVRNVRRSFGGLVAVDRVSFAVTEGHIKAVIGPNGAGKTTVFNMISGLLRTETGSVVFDGKNLTGLRPHQIAAAGIARTFQNPTVFLQMNVLENVMVGGHRLGRAGFTASVLRMPWQRREERSLRENARARLEYVGLAHLGESPAAGLAFGQRRMVELARALALAPKLLLLDEPASGLNTRETSDLAKLIRRIRGDGVTVLLVEHDMSLVMDISDEILVLHNGTPIAEGPPETVQNDPKVISIYLGENDAA